MKRVFYNIKKILTPTTVIFVLALLIRLGFLVYQFKFSETFQSAPYIPASDRRDYDSTALSLLAGYGYKTPDMLLTFRPPFYPLMLTFLYSFLGQSYHSYLAIFLIQAFLSSLSVVFIFIIGKKIFNPLTGLTAALLACFYFPFITGIGDLELENLLILMPLLFIYYLSKIEADSSSGVKIFAGLLMGLAMLTKSVFLAVLPFFTFFWLKLIIKGKQFWQSIFMVYLSAVLIFSPWVIRNFLIFKKFILSSQQGIALYANTNPEFRQYNRIQHRTFLWELPQLNEAERNSYYTNVAIENIKKNPYLYLKSMLNNWQLLFDMVNFPNFFHLLSFTAIIGFIFSFIKKKSQAILLSLFFFLICVQYSLILGIDRYRMPFDWVLILFASFGVIELVRAKQPTMIKQYELLIDKVKVPEQLVTKAKMVGKILLLILLGISLATIIPKYFSKKIISYPEVNNNFVDKKISYTEVLEYQKSHQGRIGPFLGQVVIWSGEVNYLRHNSLYPLGSVKHPEESLDPEYKGFYDTYYLPSPEYSTFNLIVNRGIKPHYYGDSVVMVNFKGSLLNKLKNGDKISVLGTIIGQNFYGQIYLEANELFFAEQDNI